MWRKPPSASVSRLVPRAYKALACSLLSLSPQPPPSLPLLPRFSSSLPMPCGLGLAVVGLDYLDAQQPPSTGTSNGSRWLELAASAMVYRRRQPPRQYSVTLLTDTPKALWDNASATRCRLLGGWYSTSTTDPDWPHFRHRMPWQQSSVCSISFLHDDYMARLDTPLVVDQ